MDLRACIRVDIQLSPAKCLAPEHDAVVVAVASEDSPAAGLEGLLECHSELAVEVSVDQGVQGRVEITHPEDCSNNNWRAIAR